MTEPTEAKKDRVEVGEGEESVAEPADPDEPRPPKGGTDVADESHVHADGSVTHGERAAPQGRYLALLSLAALGIVYGDIGTSPIYAIRESLSPTHQVAASPENVLGVLSLIVWTLVVIISIKYQLFVLRAHNRGEGGILSLTSLVTPVGVHRGGGRRILILLGLFGAALLYGESMLTPSVSVLSAVEGLSLITPVLSPYVIPITIALLVLLFTLQSRGTAGVGKLFGPITLLWFFVLAGLGLWRLSSHPEVLRAVNPVHAVHFFTINGYRSVLVMGSVFLAVTGGETLYADLGHFGPRPIRLTWFTIVMPSLMLNYFGQGALILGDPAAAENPFFLMAPRWGLVPLVLLTTVATIIASQAVISGAFSLTRQAVQLGYIPRVDIEHTSEREMGQIYVPSVNWALMLACIALVVGFGSSSRLAAAYGVAVTTTMVVTTLLFQVVARERWKWPLWWVVPLCGFFLVVELSFWGANLLKVLHGGWFPLLIAAIAFTVMTTWKTGRQILSQRLATSSIPVEFFMADLEDSPPRRMPGTAVFMFGNPDGTPPALLHVLQHFRTLHEQVVLLVVETAEVPHVPRTQRLSTEELGDGFFRIILRYGYMEDPHVPRDLEGVTVGDLDLDPENTTFFLGRETLIATRQRVGMALWRDRLFAFLARNARNATSFFHLPPDRVAELGVQVEI
jgi:KUP system potassium uptake protein